MSLDAPSPPSVPPARHATFLDGSWRVIAARALCSFQLRHSIGREERLDAWNDQRMEDSEVHSITDVLVSRATSHESSVQRIFRHHARETGIDSNGRPLFHSCL